LSALPENVPVEMIAEMNKIRLKLLKDLFLKLMVFTFIIWLKLNTLLRGPVAVSNPKISRDNAVLQRFGGQRVFLSRLGAGYFF
jgi:hypothetical protein